MNKFTIIFVLTVSFVLINQAIDSNSLLFKYPLYFLGVWNLINAVYLLKKELKN